MLKSLLIENYALIQKLELGFDEGLTIITGETGAGKSILLGALGLILGNRADTRVLFDQDTKCIIEGVFSLNQLNLQEFFTQNELDYEETTILRREITPQGKSRAFINDTPVNLPVLKALAEKLIDIHSQHQNLLFSESAFRYDLIDAFAGITAIIVNFRKSYTDLLQLRKKLTSLQDQERQARAELDYFRFQYDELHKATLIPGETEELGAELEILNNAGEIRTNLERADYLLSSDNDNVLAAINQVIGLCRTIEKFDPAFGEILARLQSASIELKDIAQEIAARKEDVTDDPVRTAHLQQRFDFLQKLLFKHNSLSIDDLIKLKDDFKNRIEGVETMEEEIEKLSKDSQLREEQLIKVAAGISSKRTEAVPLLEDEINAILKELGMPNGRFVVQIQPESGLGVNGSDNIDFLFSANSGLAPQELSRVASGGELSRLMLAIKSVISFRNLLPTIIFDEIDTGVSGEIGFKMSNMLHKISRNMQVIAVTHLPQVAARGKKHFVVFKNIENLTTSTSVRELSQKERVIEIAQMLGGANPGPAVLQAAEELFEKQNINQN